VDRRRALVVTALALGFAIFLLAPRYNDAQRADTAAAFRAVVEAGTPWRFAVAAVLDLGFAAAYGLLGITIGWRSWRGRAARRIGRAAGVAIALGAVSDLAENVLVLAATVRSAVATGSSIDAMRTLGDVKWTLAGAGFLALLATAALDRP
jgi:hypothetical protein